MRRSIKLVSYFVISKSHLILQKWVRSEQLECFVNDPCVSSTIHKTLSGQRVLQSEASNFYYRWVFFIPDWPVMIKCTDILKVPFWGKKKKKSIFQVYSSESTYLRRETIMLLWKCQIKNPFHVQSMANMPHRPHLEKAVSLVAFYHLQFLLAL